MPLSPAPLTIGQKKLMFFACVLLTVSAVLFLVTGLVKGIGPADGLGVVDLLVAGASIWLYRRTPVRDGQG